jgi:hypothetical protein
MRATTLLAILTLAAACRGKEAAERPAMAGMSMRSDSIMRMMRAHLDSLAAVSPQFAAGMLVAHDAMASQMLDAMGSDMRMMDMRPDSAWTALADSVRRDLAELPSLAGRALETRMQAHVGRMRRLLDMHTTMMHE